MTHRLTEIHSSSVFALTFNRSSFLKMSEASTKTCLKVSELSAQPATNPEVAKESQKLRSESTRTLTEKGKEMQEEMLKRVRRRYKMTMRSGGIM